LLTETLEEEKETDEKLTKLAEEINPQAKLGVKPGRCWRQEEVAESSIVSGRRSIKAS